MEINRAGAVAGAQRALSGAQAKPSKELDQDAFMKLLTTQMQAQDPLNPMDNTESSLSSASLRAWSGSTG